MRLTSQQRDHYICHYMGESSQRFEPAEGTHILKSSIKLEETDC